MAAPAREAFAAGWAISGGPMTERIRVASTTAVRLAIESADDPDALKVTIDLGRLEGMWALLFQRREEQQAAHIKAVRSEWRSLIDRDVLAAAVDRLRGLLGLGEADRDHSIRADALAAAQAMLHALRDLTGWHALRDKLTDAIRAGRAEGMVNAVAIAAEQTAVLGLDWNIAFRDAYDSLARLDEIWTDTDGWLAKTLDRATADLGSTLADAAEQGLSREEMIDAGMDILTADRDAVAFVTDWAMTTAADQGALSLYASEGVSQIDIISAGDGRVCPACLDAEAKSPWTMGDQPPMPLHPLCVVGSTRVAVPGRVVPADIADRLAPDPTHAGVSDFGEIGSSATSAVTGAGSDFGRANVGAVAVRDYVGDVVIVRTASGKELTATPNHPVATRLGWVPIAELKVGDHVLSSTRSEWSSFSGPHVDDVPPRIEEVAESFPVTLGPVPTSSEDFHGDGAGSNVHVVRTDGFLWDRGEPGSQQHVGEPDLGGGYVAGYASFSVERSAHEFLMGAPDSAPRGVGSFGEARSFLRAGGRHADVHGGTAIAGLNPSPAQPDADGSAPDAERLRQGLLALPGQVAGDQRRSVHRDVLAAHVALAGIPERNVGSLEARIDHTPADAEGFCERTLTLASDVTSDEVVNIELQRFSGHVYNLETVEGWYVANGILTHNCRCTYAADVDLAHFASWFT